MENFAKVLKKNNSSGFAFLCKKFPKVSQAKMKEEIFVGPQIWELLEDRNFEKMLTEHDSVLGKRLSDYVQIFWQTMSSLFQEGVKNLLQVYKDIDWCISLKVHFLH